MEQWFIHVFITKVALFAVIVLRLFMKLIEALINEILEQEIIDTEKLALEALLDLVQQFKEEIDTGEIKFCSDALLFQ